MLYQQIYCFSIVILRPSFYPFKQNKKRSPLFVVIALVRLLSSFFSYWFFRIFFSSEASFFWRLCHSLFLFKWIIWALVATKKFLEKKRKETFAASIKLKVEFKIDLCRLKSFACNAISLEWTLLLYNSVM